MGNEIRKIKWKFWEYALIVAGYLFGYNHEVYYSVKHNRNMAYFAWKFPERKEKK